MNNHRVLLSLLLASASAMGVTAACQVVDKNDYTFTDNPASGGTAGTSGGDECTVGQFQCSEAGVLLACENGAWQDEAAGTNCESVALCNAAVGACRECAPGEFRCTGETLEQCNLDGTAFELTAKCLDADSCNVSSNTQKGYCTVCEPGGNVCDPKVVLTAGVVGAGSPQAATELRECNDDGSGTVLVETCSAGAPTCDATAGACTRCAPDETLCLDGKVMQCDAEGSAFAEVEDCGTVALCDPAAVAVEGDPPAPGCRVGTCDPTAALKCDSAGDIAGCDLNGEPYDVVNCLDLGRCDASERRCLECVPDQQWCNGDMTEVCVGSWINQAGNESVRPWYPLTGESYGYYRCSSADTCVESSPTYAYCSAPGYPYCYLTGKAVYTGEGTSSQCPGSEVCTGTDSDPMCGICRPDHFWCTNDNVLKGCASDGSVVEVSDDCGNGYCAAALKKCLPARPGDRFCSPDGQLGQVTTEGEIIELEQCAGPAACDPDRGCLQGRCRVGTTVCDGDAVFECTNGRAVEDTGDECASAARCSPGIGCTEAIAIAAGDAHTCAILADGDSGDGDPGVLMCWGANESGQLGNGSTVLGDSLEPRHVVAYPLGDMTKPPVASPTVTSVCAGKDFSCATHVTQAGSVVLCWGSNASGQLGMGNAEAGPFNYASSPVTTDSAPIVASSVVCGADFACALGAEGQTWCWGANDVGQVGNGEPGDPVDVATLIAEHAFVSLAAGAEHACGVKDDGSVLCWGEGMSGQLGSGDTDDAHSPTPVSGVTANVGIGAALGRDFSLIASEELNPFAFGLNGYGQLGTGDTVDSASAVAAAALSSDDIDGLFAGATSAHACARVGSRLLCWGANVFGQIGDDTLVSVLSPAEVFSGATNATKLRGGNHSVAVGGRHTCAINAVGDILCWGANHRSQLGTDAPTPVTVPSQTL